MKKSFNEICSLYLEKNGWEDSLDDFSLGLFDLIVVIPCHNENDILPSLNSLISADHSACKILIIVIVNASQKANDSIKLKNIQTYQDIVEFESTLTNTHFSILPILNNELPDKTAGVGLARKIGMDLAIKIFAKNENDGLICCFDADSKCQENYFAEIINTFQETEIDAASIHFEHPLSGVEFDGEVYKAILLYELHLRYYINIQKWVGLPFAFQTIGSSMAVRASSYCLYGGMNKRKAGEDFYFLHKFISKGSFKEIKQTTVIPSPRISDRVPFGTGKAVNEIINESEMKYMTYHPQIFIDLKQWLSGLQSFFESTDLLLPNESHISNYFLDHGLLLKLTEIKAYTKDYDGFKKRFYQWFDAFALMKLIHYFRDHGFPSVPIYDAANTFLSMLDFEHSISSELEALWKLRSIDKS